MNRLFKLLACSLCFVIFSACRNTTTIDKNKTKTENEKTLNTHILMDNMHTAPGGIYSFERPQNFGLAVKKEQILKKSYIPPCKEGFDYCLYYNGKKYKNTNFETAGVGFYILKNIGEEACLSVNDYHGRKDLHSETINGIEFIVFSSGDAAMGHYASDRVYRTFQNGECYVFIARIGVSQFENYEPGTIEKFTPEMEKKVRNALKKILQGITFNQK